MIPYNNEILIQAPTSTSPVVTEEPTKVFGIIKCIDPLAERDHLRSRRTEHPHLQRDAPTSSCFHPTSSLPIQWSSWSWLIIHERSFATSLIIHIQWKKVERPFSKKPFAVRRGRTRGTTKIRTWQNHAPFKRLAPADSREKVLHGLFQDPLVVQGLLLNLGMIL